MPANSNYILRCPSCYSPDHVAYRLRVSNMDLGTIYGESMRHCEACGLKFPATSGLELRALAPTTPHNERRIIEQDLSQDGDRSWSRV